MSLSEISVTSINLQRIFTQLMELIKCVKLLYLPLYFLNKIKKVNLKQFLKIVETKLVFL